MATLDQIYSVAQGIRNDLQGIVQKSQIAPTQIRLSQGLRPCDLTVGYGLADRL